MSEIKRGCLKLDTESGNLCPNAHASLKNRTPGSKIRNCCLKSDTNVLSQTILSKIGNGQYLHRTLKSLIEC